MCDAVASLLVCYLNEACGEADLCALCCRASVAISSLCALGRIRCLDLLIGVDCAPCVIDISFVVW